MLARYAAGVRAQSISRLSESRQIATLLGFDRLHVRLSPASLWQFAWGIGDITLEGVDGDASFTIVPGWQLIGSFYAGHLRDPFNNPIPNGFDNSWSAYTRYNFAKDCVLSGFSLGGGITRIGGRWMSSGGLVYTSGYLPNYIKVQTGTLVTGFVDYRLDKHWSFRVLCNNLLDQHYPLGVETAYIIDPSPGRIFSFETSYKY